jgi:hypothetical protein
MIIAMIGISLMALDDIFTETNSPHIQKDVIKLLSSSNNDKFADAIGIGPSEDSS